PHDGAEAYAGGYVHLTEHNDERYCRQLVAETLKEREWRGRIIKEWVAKGDNHFHDCRIYNMALFDHLGGNRLTDDEWRTLAKQRGVKPEAQKDLFVVAAEPALGKSTEVVKPPPGRRMRSKGIS